MAFDQQRCETCIVTVGPEALTALAAIEATPKFGEARLHRIRTQWPGLIAVFSAMLAAIIGLGVVMASEANTATWIFLGVFGVLFGVGLRVAIRNARRPRGPRAGTVVCIRDSEMTNSKGGTSKFRKVTFVFADGTEALLTDSGRKLGLDKNSYGRSFIAFVDVDNVYEVWPDELASVLDQLGT
jgi:hypothetical protein